MGQQGRCLLAKEGSQHGSRQVLSGAEQKRPSSVSSLKEAAHRYLANWPRRTAADCSSSRSSGVTKGEGVSSRIF